MTDVFGEIKSDIVMSAGQVVRRNLADNGFEVTTLLQFSGLNKITVGTTQPTSPSVGDIWVDTN